MTDKKWYKVKAEATTDLYAFVEAENAQDAYEKARWHDEPDASKYIEENDGQSGDWITGSDPQEVTTVDGEIELKLWLDK